MPSPFPGMDPWLEKPTEWPGFHDILIVKTVEVLQPHLRERGYYANPGERVWLTQPERPIYPDVAAIRRSRRDAPHQSGGIAMIEPDEPVEVDRTEVEVHESFVEIYDAARNQLITGIEFLSPANKTDSVGKKLYQTKQREMEDANVHLVEIDLLRSGMQVLDIPEHIVKRLKPWDYLVNLVRRGASRYSFYPIRLRDRLPRIRIPLKEGDEDAVLDLQDVFTRSYDIGPYPERLNYTADPSPMLSDEDAAWADGILKSKGFRK